MDDFTYADDTSDLRGMLWDDRVLRGMGLKDDVAQQGLSMLERYTKQMVKDGPPLPHLPGPSPGNMLPPPQQHQGPATSAQAAAAVSTPTTSSTSKRKRKSPKKVGNRANANKANLDQVDMSPMFYTMPTPAPKQDTVFCNVCKIGFSNWQCLKLHAKVHERHNFGMDKLAQQFADEGGEGHLSINIDAAPVTEPELKVIMAPITTTATNKNGQNSPYSLSNKIYVMADGSQFTITGPPYKCMVCHKEYRKGHELHEHIRIHTGEKPYVCDRCDKTFRLRRSLRDHSVVHTGEKRFKCRQCGKPFRSKDQRWNHESLHTGERPYKCDRCASAFRYPALLRQHKKLYCRVRKAETGNKSGEGAEDNKDDEDKSDEMDEDDRLNSSRFPFPSFPSYQFQSNPLLTPKMPGAMAFPLPGGSLPPAVSSMTGEYSLWDGMRGLQNNSQPPPQPQQPESIKVEAGAAQGGFPVAISSKQIVSVQVMSPDPGVTSSVDHKCFKSHICSVCGKIFRTPSKLRQHVYQHTGETPYPCPHCERAFKQKKRLIEHVRIHTGEKPYICRYCGRAYRVRGELRKHEHTHTGVRPHVCEECGQAFTWKKSLRTHRLIHTNERPHVCEVCGASFRHRVSLRNHRRHHEKGQFFSAEQVAKISSRARKNKAQPANGTDTGADASEGGRDDGSHGEGPNADLSFSSSDGSEGQGEKPDGGDGDAPRDTPKPDPPAASQPSAPRGNISCPICNASFGRQEELFYHLQFHQFSMDSFPAGVPTRPMSTPTVQPAYPGYLEARPGGGQFELASNHPGSRLGRLDSFGSVFPHPVPISGNTMGGADPYGAKYKGYPYVPGMPGMLPLQDKQGNSQQAVQQTFNFHPPQAASPAIRQDSQTPSASGSFNVFPTAFPMAPMGANAMAFTYSRPLPLASPMNLSMSSAAAAIVSQSNHMTASNQHMHFRNTVGSPAPNPQNLNSSSSAVQRMPDQFS